MGNCTSNEKNRISLKNYNNFGVDQVTPDLNIKKEENPQIILEKIKKDLEQEKKLCELSDKKTSSSTSQEINYLLPKNLANHNKITNFYDLQHEIGSGACGKVVVASNKNGQKFAVKIIQKKTIKNIKEIISEINFSTKLKHPNIIEFYEVFEDKDSIYYVMELGEGGDLFDFIVNSPEGHLPLNLSIDLSVQIFETLNYLHKEKQIIHRDLKPENFLVKITKDNIPLLKLIDFGFACNIPEDFGHKIFNEYVGTPAYSAPELVIRRPYDHKVDIWAAGVILFNMLTGFEPFNGETEADLEDEIKYKDVDFNVIEDEDMRELCKNVMERIVSRRINAEEALKIVIEIKRKKDEILKEEN